MSRNSLYRYQDSYINTTSSQLDKQSEEGKYSRTQRIKSSPSYSGMRGSSKNFGSRLGTGSSAKFKMVREDGSISPASRGTTKVRPF